MISEDRSARAANECEPKLHDENPLFRHVWLIHCDRIKQTAIMKLVVVSISK